MQVEIANQLQDTLRTEMEKIGNEFMEVLKRASTRAYEDMLKQFGMSK